MSMTYEKSLNKYGLVPRDEDLPAIRQLLAREAKIELDPEGDEEREDELALLCSVQLFSRGLLEDVLRIWDAKTSGFDLSCLLDVQFLCGAGLERTKQFLSEHPSEEAASALEYINKCEQVGDFTDWSPSDHLEKYRRYFSVE